MLNFKVIFAILLGTLQGILSLGCAWLLKVVVDIVTGTNVNFDFRDFCILASAYYLIYIFIYWLSKKVYAKTIVEIRTKTKERLSKGLIWQSEQLHQKSQIGEVISCFQYQVDALESMYYEPLFKIIRNGVTCVISFGTLIYFQWQITLICVLLYVVFWILTHSIQKKLNDFQEKVIEASEKENSALVTMVKGFHTARDCGKENFFHSRYSEGAKLFAQMNFRYEFMYDVFSSISMLLEPAITLLVILMGGAMLNSEKAMITTGVILGMTQLLSSILGTIGEIGATISQIKSAKPIRQNFQEYERAGTEGKAIWEASGTYLPKLKKISFQDVSCAYGEDTVLERVSLELFYGKKYAIVGESGSGKTTLLRLILKQLTQTKGFIWWNDISYEDIGKSSIIPHIGYVSQSPMIFHKNVKENILVGSEEDDEKLAEVLCYSKLTLCRGGMDKDALLSLPARELSGGEKKRLAYARALYKDYDILILDEFTSSVHEQMAEELEAGIFQNDAQLVIHVTHTLKEENMQLYNAVFAIKNKMVVQVYPEPL